MLAEEVRGTDYDIVEVTISAAEIGCGMMTRGTDKCECCSCLVSPLSS